MSSLQNTRAAPACLIGLPIQCASGTPLTLNILARIPNVDLIAADREIERAFEREAPMTGSVECSDALLERYRMAREGGAERALDYLAETVRDR
ncbi:MAG: hypothetical protein DI589_21285 [Shinella sp.]|nr:MAG: hypothetical protein DI589_21285 [Shinella sp.]